MNFTETKQAYHDARKQQQSIISHYFRNKEDFEINGRIVFNGSKTYKSGSKFTNSYDLSGWQWIALEHHHVQFIISLQSFDIDSKTQNLHVLMDRIGIYAYVGTYSSYDALHHMMITDIDLPMDNKKLERLSQIIMELSECDIYKRQYELEQVKHKYNLVQTDE